MAKIGLTRVSSPAYDSAGNAPEVNTRQTHPDGAKLGQWSNMANDYDPFTNFCEVRAMGKTKALLDLMNQRIEEAIRDKRDMTFVWLEPSTQKEPDARHIGRQDSPGVCHPRFAIEPEPSEASG